MTTITEPLTYAQWLIRLVSVGQTYGVKSYQWNECLSAAFRDLSFRTWALADDAEQAVKQAVAR